VISHKHAKSNHHQNEEASVNSRLRQHSPVHQALSGHSGLFVPSFSAVCTLLFNQRPFCVTIFLALF